MNTQVTKVSQSMSFVFSPRSLDQSMTIAMKQLGIYNQGFELILYLRRPHDRDTVKTVSCGNSTSNATV